MMPQVQCEIAGRKFSISTGDIAFQSDGAALVKYGDTSVLVTVCVSQSIAPDTPFLPLTVDYQEKAGAAGRIPGGYYKREGKPHETEIVTARLIDRPIRPLFAKDFLHNVQVTAIVFSADQENHPDVPAIIGASFALLAAGLPFNGPIGAVRIGQIGRELVVNPTVTELETSTLDMVVAGTKQGITMIEASAYEVDEPTVFEALEIAHTEIIKAIELQEELLNSIEITPFEYRRMEIDPTIKADIERKYKDAIINALNHTRKKDRHNLLEKIWLNIQEEYPDNPYVVTIVEEIKNTYIRELILKEHRRLDGRKPTDVRPISCEVSVLPRVHGSALFTRGETQSLAVTTLGTAADEQHVEELTGESWKTFMLHYNFPPFSTGEAAPLKAPRRREIGHGRLAEKALEPILPASEAFPYTIRVVSDILSSNGSSSMATVCAGSLSLMDAGVPTKTHVAGIAMGLVDDVILTDILGEEDHAGDMDFKVAGTRDGITAIQLDIKVPGISKDILKDALEGAKSVRHYIIGLMEKVLPGPRSEISPYAPKIKVMEVPKEKIGQIIGPGGTIIREIIERSGAEIEVKDSRIVFHSKDKEATEKAYQMVSLIVNGPCEGRIYIGRVKRILPFGAIVEIAPGVDGMIHISQLDHKRVKRVEEVVKIGDEVAVKVIGFDDEGRPLLSRKALLKK